MSNKWETVELDGKLYAFEMIPPEESIALSLRFMEAFGGIIASFIPMLNVDSDEIDIFNMDFSALNLHEVQTSMMSAANHMDAKKIKPIIDAVLPMTIVTNTKDRTDNGHRCSYDDFNGKIKTLYKVIFFSLRYNFSDFFPESLQSGITAQEANCV